MLIISHPTGNANVRAAVNGFAEAGILSKFYTTISSFPGGILDKIGTLKVFSELKRRHYDSFLRPYTKAFPYREAGRLAASKTGFTKLIEHEKGPFCIDEVYRSLDKKVARFIKKNEGHAANAVYCYEDGALFTFREAKHFDLKCFYDLPIGYWRSSQRLLEIEKERWPEWASTITTFLDSNEKLARKDEELSLSNRIFVASKFTASTLKEFPGKLAPVEVIPYGFPVINQTKKFTSNNPHRPLKILFVGSLSQRKGIADLFKVSNQLRGHVELTVIGKKTVSNCNVLNTELSKHNWIPGLPHSEILKLMQECDVLIFPSLFEGFGLVITEAMSQGTPVITTERTIGPDIIKNGENGWLIKAGCTDSLLSAIEKLLYNFRYITDVGYAARETAKCKPWFVYSKELTTAIKKYIQ
jgi:glycosyltransferase involved in cell wall biosynthesis